LARSLDVAIVGAGPYGLSVAAHLQRPSLRMAAFGKPMETWRAHMPRGMALKSDGFASNLHDPSRALTLKAYCLENDIAYADLGLPVALETFCSYGMWFRERAGVALDERLVTRIERHGPGFALVLDDGQEILARRVILAVGVSHFSHSPAELAHLPRSMLTHSSDHADPGAFAGRDVTILGAGASALDLAMLLHEGGATTRVVARRDKVAFHSRAVTPRPLLEQLRRPTSALGPGWRSLAYCVAPHLFRLLPSRTRLEVVGRALGPAAGWTVRERVEGKVSMLLGRRVVGASAENAQLVLRLADSDGRETEIKTDHLIAATGYRVDLGRLAFLSETIMRDLRLLDGSPRLNGSFESSVPGLFFVGLAAANMFGPLQRFAHGARFAARRLARYLP
jgi:cation diffusion facilitator CzcD-associated flavoprotein CzcO